MKQSASKEPVATDPDPGISKQTRPVTADISAATPARFVDIAPIAVDWYWEMDRDLRFTFLSRQFEEVTGIDTDAVIGKTREEAFAGLIDDSDKWQRNGESLNRHGSYSMVWSLQRADGGIRILLTRGQPQLGAEGEFQGYRGVGHDITEAAGSNQQFFESEYNFRSILDHVTDIVCIVDSNGEIRFLNQSVEAILGYSVAEFVSKSASEYVLPEERDRIAQAVRRARENPGQAVGGTYRYRHRNGSIRFLQMTRQCVRQAEPEAAPDLLIHARDVTDQYFAEKALRESEERLRDFAETGADWFWEQDAELRFTYLSGNYPEFQHMETDKIIGQRREDFLPGALLESKNFRQLGVRLEAGEAFHNFEYDFPRPDGSVVMVRISGKPRYDEDGQFIGYRGCGNDITESYRLSQQLNYQATHDPLTGLVNRREFELRLARIVKSCRTDNSENALCYIDLDQFKVVNDTCGHDAGDELLRQIAALLRDKLRQRDTVARLGGDEFGLLLEPCTLTQANRAAEMVREAIEQFRFMWGGRNFRLGASIGVIPINFASGNVSKVMRSADAACYTAKDAGRNRIHIYSPDNAEVAQRHQEMQRVVDISNAFDEGRLVLHQQAIQALNPELGADGHYSEVLVRMIDEQGKSVPPGAFMPTAERFNLVTQLDTWVINATLDWLLSSSSIRCSINLSGMSIADPDFLQYVLAVLDNIEVDPKRICFEITETAAIANLSKATEFINSLRECGCEFALDDFGSGLSSFAYLKTLPVEYLKIDGFFVRDMVQDRINYELVKSINDIGHVMGKKTIAEFVENEEILDALREIGVDYAQGYHIARPVLVEY